MEKLGLRIKRLRKEKGVKQSFLHDNQSAVSQIERGFNEKPSPELLRKVAENLEVTFEELVKGTSWSAPKDSNSEGKYGYSELDFELTLNDAGKITIEHKRYPKYDSNGLENRFCPRTSSALIFNCKSCKKPIQSNQQVFCMGCGTKIFQEQIYRTVDDCLLDFQIDGLFLKIKEIKNNSDPSIVQDEIERLFHDNESKRENSTKKYFDVKTDFPLLKEVIDTLQAEKYPQDRFGNSFSIDKIKREYKEFGPDTDDRIRHLFSGKYFFDDPNIKYPERVDTGEYIKGLKSKDKQYYNFQVALEYRIRFISLLAHELSKLLLSIDDASVQSKGDIDV